MNEIVLGVYGILMIGGGFFGAKSGSKISLIAGVISGICVFIGLWMAKTNPQLGFGFLWALTLLLTAMFLVRLLKTKKFMPSGMLLILSVVACIAAITSFLANNSPKI